MGDQEETTVHVQHLRLIDDQSLEHLIG
jgi:hypothetical protein